MYRQSEIDLVAQTEGTGPKSAPCGRAGLDGQERLYMSIAEMFSFKKKSIFALTCVLINICVHMCICMYSYMCKYICIFLPA